MKETDLVFPGDWIAVDNVIYLAARVDHEKIGLFNLFTGQRWTEPTDYCGQAPLGGTPLINFNVMSSARPCLVRRGTVLKESDNEKGNSGSYEGGK